MEEHPDLVKELLTISSQDWDRDASRCGEDDEHVFKMREEHFAESIFELAGTR